jgi:hypothetical protein
VGVSVLLSHGVFISVLSRVLCVLCAACCVLCAACCVLCVV